MNQEYLKELNELREYLEISKNEFKILLLLALKYQNENKEYIHEENLYEIVEEALNNMDNQENCFLNDDSFAFPKTIQQAFERALCNLGYQKVKKNR